MFDKADTADQPHPDTCFSILGHTRCRFPGTKICRWGLLPYRPTHKPLDQVSGVTQGILLSMFNSTVINYSDNYSGNVIYYSVYILQIKRSVYKTFKVINFQEKGTLSKNKILFLQKWKVLSAETLGDYGSSNIRTGVYLKNINEPPYDKTSDDSDQPEQSPNKIRIFAVCMKKHWALDYP